MDEIRDHHVRVQLGIARPRGSMPKRSREKTRPVDRHEPVVTATPLRRRALEIPERVLDRAVMRGSDRPLHALVADAEQHAHALRRRERQIEAGHAIRTARRQHRTRRRMRAGERQPKPVVAHAPGQVELHCDRTRASSPWPRALRGSSPRRPTRRSWRGRRAPSPARGSSQPGLWPASRSTASRGLSRRAGAAGKEASVRMQVRARSVGSVVRVGSCALGAGRWLLWVRALLLVG